MKSLAYTFLAASLAFSLFGMAVDPAAFLFALFFGLMALLFFCLASASQTKRDKRKLAALEALAQERRFAP